MNLSAARQPATGPYGPAAADMFSYIRKSTPENSVIMFFKPHALRLLTDRDAFMSTDCADLSNAGFVVLFSGIGVQDQVSPARITNCNPMVRLTREYGRGEFEMYAIERRFQEPSP